MNYSMIEKLRKGEAIDVSKCPKTEEGYYILPSFSEGFDYCDAETEEWIWSIGLHKESDTFHASLKADLYDAPGYKCVWLR